MPTGKKKESAAVKKKKAELKKAKANRPKRKKTLAELKAANAKKASRNVANIEKRKNSPKWEVAARAYKEQHEVYKNATKSKTIGRLADNGAFGTPGRVAAGLVDGAKKLSKIPGKLLKKQVELNKRRRKSKARNKRRN